MDKEKIKEILLRGNYISEEELKIAEKNAKSHRVSFVDYLISQNTISKDILGQAIAEYLGFPYADLNSTPPTRKQVLKIPEEIAKKYKSVLFREEEGRVLIATDDPKKPELINEVAKIFPNKEVYLAYSLTGDIQANLFHYQKSLETRFSKIIESAGRVAPELLEEIFDDALVYHASDIHFEPKGENILIRFRIDGVLQDSGRIPTEYYENILNRIKVKSGLRIDEHLIPQDGSLHYEKNNVAVDMRTSIIPTVKGEKVVLRVLQAYLEGFTLNDLGLSEIHNNTLKEAANKPFGMILVTGPTGSGKTTTLYSLLQIVNTPDVNITTIEDPVEYKLSGINQIQVNSETNLTFAQGLRSIVRQDPDVILVGEVRDRETAEIAVNAALTGHLLFSTFHANDAATAIPRLLDMGIEPFLLASTLEVVVGQRLVRKICEHCRRSTEKTTQEFDRIKYKNIDKYFGIKSKKITLYEGKGCEQCGYTGYKGRTAIFEFIKVSPSIQELILNSPSAKSIWQLAEKEGSKPLFEDGLAKVRSGITTLEELFRVAEPRDK